MAHTLFRVRVWAFKYPILELFCAARSATASLSKRSGRLVRGDSCLYEGLRQSQPGGRGDRGTKQCTTVQLACGQFFPSWDELEPWTKVAHGARIFLFFACAQPFNRCSHVSSIVKSNRRSKETYIQTYGAGHKEASS